MTVSHLQYGTQTLAMNFNLPALLPYSSFPNLTLGATPSLPPKSPHYENSHPHSLPSLKPYRPFTPALNKPISLGLVDVEVQSDVNPLSMCTPSYVDTLSLVKRHYM